MTYVDEWGDEYHQPQNQINCWTKKTSPLSNWVIESISKLATNMLDYMGTSMLPLVNGTRTWDSRALINCF